MLGVRCLDDGLIGGISLVVQLDLTLDIDFVEQGINILSHGVQDLVGWQHPIDRFWIVLVCVSSNASTYRYTSSTFQGSLHSFDHVLGLQLGDGIAPQDVWLCM